MSIGGGGGGAYSPIGSDPGYIEKTKAQKAKRKESALRQRDAARSVQKQKSAASAGRKSTILTDLFTQLNTELGDTKTLLGL